MAAKTIKLKNGPELYLDVHWPGHGDRWRPWVELRVGDSDAIEVSFAEARRLGYWLLSKVGRTVLDARTDVHGRRA